MVILDGRLNLISINKTWLKTYAVAFKISRFKAIMLYWIRVLFPLNIKYGKHGKKKKKQTNKKIN